MEQNEDKPKKMGRQFDICAQKRAALRRPKTHQQYGVPLKVVPYKSLYGWTMDEIVKEIGLKNNCTFCGVFRCQRRKCLEDNPESSSKDEPVVFHTYMIPWWVWAKRFYLPEVELLSGRVALIGFFMAYLVESLTGVGLVDQMDSGFGKLFFLITVAGVFLIRKNEDLPNLKQFVKEWTLYDKQWKATWQDETPENPERD